MSVIQLNTNEALMTNLVLMIHSQVELIQISSYHRFPFSWLRVLQPHFVFYRDVEK